MAAAVQLTEVSAGRDIRIQSIGAVYNLPPAPSADIELRVRGLLEAMGYRINDTTGESLTH